MQLRLCTQAFSILSLSTKKVRPYLEPKYNRHCLAGGGVDAVRAGGSCKTPCKSMMEGAQHNAL